MDAATALKDEGNKALQENHFEKATELYSQAIELHPTAILYSNRALAAIRMENYGMAIQDAEAAIDLDPSYLKAFYRRGSANYALGKVSVSFKCWVLVLRFISSPSLPLSFS